MKVAVEQVFNGSLLVASGAYDSTRINVGSLIRQWDIGSNPGDKFVGPFPIVALRPAEQSTSIPANFVQLIPWSATEWWVFYSDHATAAATRRVGLYTWNPTTNATSWRGFVTLTYPVATVHTIRGFRMARTTYSAGTVAVSGTAVTGTSTAFSASRLAVGSRIGFGSTDPTAITTWYEISAIGSDTSITLTATAGTIGAGSAYVIEELRAITVNTNATATNGGVFVAKGLRFENFISAGTTIPAATTVDNIRAVYWLRDAATVTLTTACGVGVDAPASQTSHDIYAVQGGGTSNAIVHRYNIRAALTVASGAATLSGGDLTLTGTVAVTGTLSQNGNIRVDTLSHGPGSGVKSLYFVTASRILRAAVSGITAGSTTWLSDQMTEVPPGSVNSFPATAAFASVEVAGSLDRLIVSTGTSERHYVTQYRTDAGQMDHVFLCTDRQQDNASASADLSPHPSCGLASPLYHWIEQGACATVRQNTSSVINQIWLYPLGAHWSYAATTGQRAKFPELNLGATPAKFYRVTKQTDEYLGANEIGVSPEAIRLYYRTAGISDDSGGWTAVPADGDLSGVSSASSIQFMAEWRTIGTTCVPGRLVSLALIYESADALPSQYRWNHGDFDASNGTFAWVQRALFGGSLTVHTINIYRADTNALVLTQASSGSANGTFEYWTGSAWAAGLHTDTVGTRRRFVPTGSLPSGVDLYAELTVA